MKNIKPSELIELSLHDLEVVESMPDKYEINMGFWHAAFDNRCDVCLAGAVMAVSLHLPATTSIVSVDDFKPEFSPMFRALNCFRIGRIQDGLGFMGISREVDDVPVSEYADSRVNFKRNMKWIVTFLKSLDL